MSRATIFQRALGVAKELSRRELVIVCLVVPVLLFPSRYSHWGLLALVGVYIVNGVSRGSIGLPSPFCIPVALLPLLVIPGLRFSSDFSASLAAAYKLVAGLALFSALARWFGDRQVQKDEEQKWRLEVVAGAFLAVGVGLALVGLTSNAWAEDKFFSWPALYAAFPRLLVEKVNPNVLGQALAQLIPIPFALLVMPLDGIKRLPWTIGLLLALFIIAFSLVLGQSRTALVAASLGLFVVLALTRRRLAGALALGILLVGCGWFWHYGWERTLERAGWLLGGGAIQSWERRWEIWRRAWAIIADFPYTGIGLNTFSLVGPVRYPSLALVEAEDKITHAHNLFLQVGCDLGVGGLLVFGSLLVFLLWAISRGENLALDATGRAFRWGLIGSLAAGLVEGFLDVANWNTKLGVVFWAVAGLLVALSRPWVWNIPPELRKLLSVGAGLLLALGAMWGFRPMVGSFYGNLGNLALDCELVSGQEVLPQVDRFVGLERPFLPWPCGAQAAVGYFQRALAWGGEGAIRQEWAVGLAYSQLGEGEKALAHWRRIPEQALAELLRKGDVHLARGEYSEAQERYYLAKALGLGVSVVDYRLGMAYLKEGKLAEAEEALQKAKERTDFWVGDRVDVASCYYGLGQVYARGEQWEVAIWHHRTGLGLRPTGEAYRELGRAYYYGLHDGIRAEEALRQAIGLAPEDFASHAYLGEVLVGQKRYAEGLGELRRALGLAKNEGEAAEAHASLGETYFAQKELAAAFWEYNEAVRLVPDRADWHIRLGDIALARGQQGEARRFYLRALELAPNETRAKEALAKLQN